VAQASAAAQLARALVPHARRPASPAELVPQAVRTVPPQAPPASQGGSAAPLAVPSPGAAPRLETLGAGAKRPGVALPAPAARGVAQEGPAMAAMRLTEQPRRRRQGSQRRRCCKRYSARASPPREPWPGPLGTPFRTTDR